MPVYRYGGRALVAPVVAEVISVALAVAIIGRKRLAISEPLNVAAMSAFSLLTASISVSSLISRSICFAEVLPDRIVLHKWRGETVIPNNQIVSTEKQYSPGGPAGYHVKTAYSYRYLVHTRTLGSIMLDPNFDDIEGLLDEIDQRSAVARGEVVFPERLPLTAGSRAARIVIVVAVTLLVWTGIVIWTMSVRGR